MTAPDPRKLASFPHRPPRNAQAQHGIANEAVHASGASAANAMQVRRRARGAHRLLGPFLAAAMLVAAWVLWVIAVGTGQSNALIWPAALVLSIVLYLTMLWTARKSYRSGATSLWNSLLHAAPLMAAAVFGIGVATIASAVPVAELRLLALSGLVLCAAAFPALAALESTFRGFVLLIMLPILWGVLNHAPADLAINALVLTATACLLAGHGVLARSLNKAFRDDVEQRALVQRLQEANEALLADRMLLQTESRTDALTGLANRRYLEQMLLAEWNRCRRSGAPLSCVMLDVDHFKAYNDHYGHDGGDRCLQTVADILDNSTRRAGDVVARYGGEEFVLLLPETGSVGATTVADFLKHAVAGRAIEHAASPLRNTLTLSLGVATLLPGADRVPDELLKAADLALYEAKRTGRNRVVMADEQTLESARLTARGLIG